MRRRAAERRVAEAQAELTAAILARDTADDADMPKCVPLATLPDRIKRKLSGRALRDAANELGMSSSTLCRIQQGKHPDAKGYVTLCRWLAQ